MPKKIKSVTDESTIVLQGGYEFYIRGTGPDPAVIGRMKFMLEQLLIIKAPDVIPPTPPELIPVKKPCGCGEDE